MRQKTDRNSRRIVYQIGVWGVLVGIDLGLKWLAGVGGFGVLNQGLVLGMFPGILVTLGFFWVWVLLVMVWWLHRQRPQAWGLVWLLAGGTGNLVDRIVFGGVRDMIHYPLVHIYGNLADIYLAIGVVWWWISQDRKG